MWSKQEILAQYVEFPSIERIAADELKVREFLCYLYSV